MRYNCFQEQAHGEIDRVFRTLFPKHGMTVREEQVVLCHQMFTSLWNGQVALCDAAVGVGKTYAYLIAGILFRKYSGTLNGNYCMSSDTRPMVISTSSIALQDALLGEYIPLLSKILSEEKIIRRPIRAVLRKGKEHFVCDVRLNQRMSAVSIKKNLRQKEALQELCQTYDMDLVDHLSSFDRRMVCVPRRCPADCSLRNQCRHQSFLKQAVEEEIDIQICNHNYFLADAAHRNSGYRPLLKNYQILIIDEAHKLPEAAQQMYGKRLEKEDIAEICMSLEQGKYTHTAAKLREAFHQLFSAVLRENAMVDKGVHRRSCRKMRKPEQERLTFLPGDQTKKILKHCIRLLKKAEDTTEGKIPRWLSNRLGETRDILRLFFTTDRHWILFLEFTRKGNPILCADYRKVSDRLEREIWEQGIPAILTSGTLAAGGSFRRIRQLSGLAECSRVQECTAASPFHYKENVLLYFRKIYKGKKKNTRDNVSPEQKQIRLAADQIEMLIRTTNGHTLILFTSYTMMGSVYRELRGKISIPILRVWKDSQRVIREFKEQKNAVLFAAGSCWEGVDFPGDMVSSLIIERLPFPVPDPVREAEREKYDSLQEYIRQIVVPDMQLKLRQGFGRAIRTETDTCVVSILDSRATLGGRYHQAVVEALPECRMTENIADVEQFIRERKGIDYYM